MVRVALSGLALLTASLSQGSLTEKPSDSDKGWAVHFGPVQSWTVLGSEDHRTGVILGLQRIQPMKLRQLKKGETELILEAYHLFTRGGGIYEFSADRSFAYGLLVHSRWTSKAGSSGKLFAEAAWGFQVQDTLSHDMGSRINSTPTVGLGWMGRTSGADFQVTVRLMHISSAGLVTRNLGQNQFQLLFGVRF